MRSGFFNSNISGFDDYGNPIYDRAEEASFFAEFFADFIGTGVYANPSSNMQVMADEGMRLKIQEGRCFIKGYRGKVEPGGELITLEQADTNYSRIDRVVARLDIEDRRIKVAVLKGEAATNPVAPELTRNSNIYEIALADVLVGKNVSIITQANITDTRLDTNVCGIVAVLIEQIDTSTLFMQFKKWFEEKQAEADGDYLNWFGGFTTLSENKFNTWFDGIKNTLDGDVAGNLLNEINTKAEQLKSDYDTKFNNLKSIVVAPNAAAHNAIYRGEDITSKFYDGTLSQQIAAGTFDDIFIGDYIIGQTSGRKYLVADINYRLNTGLDECITPHVLMIPEKIMGTAKMNDSATTEGAYIGSKMYRQYLEPFRKIIRDDFGENHILKHTNLFANAVTDGCESGGAWFYRDIELMNEQMLFGNNIFHNIQNGTKLAYNYTLDKQQLSLFKLRPCTIVARNDEGERFWYWLRDVASAYSFAGVGSDGCASANGASDTSDLDSGSDSNGVRPAFLVY